MSQVRILLVLSVVLLQLTAHAQFLDSEKNPISECDCNTKLNEMYFKVPAMQYSSYDLIGFQIKTKKGTVVGQSVFDASAIRSGTVLNLLNPENLGSQNFIGMESGLFMGKDIGMSYTSLCFSKKDLKIQLEIIGINQVGTQTDYEVVGNKISARTKKIYDGGTSIHKSEEMSVLARKKHHDKWLFLGAYGATIAGYGVMWLTSVILSGTN